MKILLYAFIVAFLTACGGNASETLPTTPTDIPLEWIRIENQHTERELFTNNLIPLENCNGNRPVSLSFSRSQSTTTTTEFSVGGELEAGIREIATVKILAEYNVQNGETVSASQEYQVEVEGGTRVDYEINWYETWQAGEVVIDEYDLRFPFRVRTGLEGELSSGTAQLCPTTETLTNTPSDTPTLTFTPTDTLTYTPTSTDVPPTDIPSPTDTDAPAATFTAIPTIIPAATHIPTTEPTQMETPTVARTLTSIPVSLTPGMGTYPCYGTISSDSSGPLFVIYIRPISSLSPIASIMPGTQVVILDDTLESGRKWYQIQYDNNQKAGWLWDNYVLLSDVCP